MTTTLAAIAIAAITALQAPQAPPAQPAGTGRISGVVSRGDTNQPLEGAMLRLVRWEGGLGQQIPAKRTEADGKFTFEGLRAGEYGLTFSADAFVTLDFGQKRPSEPPRRITLQDGQHFNTADMTLPRTGAIEGRLLDEFGDPAPGITVQVARVQFAAGKTRLMPVGGVIAPRPTDDLGQFRIFNLPPGDYYLTALSGPFGGLEDPPGFAVTFFPGTVVPTDAKPVHLDVGQDVLGAAFPLVPAPMSIVSGVLTDDAGKPAVGEVMLLQTSGGDVRSFAMGRIPVAPDGSFTFRNVAPGTYVIRAYGRPVGGGNLGRAPFGSLPFTLAGGDMTGLTVKLAGATLCGKLIFDGAAPLPQPARILIFPTPVNFASAPVGGGPPNSVTRADWTFEVSNMSGLRVIRLIVGSPQWQLKRVVRDGKDITDVPIDFRDGDVDGVEITLTSAAASVTGTVKDGDKPAAECAVLVFAEDAAKWAHPSRFLAAGRTDAQGHFTVGGLPVADYLVIAVPPVQGQDWMDPATLEQYRGLATRVSVAEGEKAVVALKMIRR